MKDLKKTALKLQMALNLQGVPVVIDEKHFWSIKYHRPMTKKIVKIKWPGRPAEPIIETYSTADVVKALAAVLQEYKQQ